MSISRPKRASHKKHDEKDGDFNFLTKPEPITWDGAVEGKSDADFESYSVRNTYVVGSLIIHPKFGKGVVTFVEGKKIEVLFQETSRKFGHAMG
jgi:hypothetical protein